MTAPRASNPNLHAQGGLFTVERVKTSELDAPPRLEPLDTVIMKDDDPSKRGPEPAMYRLELPISETPKLLRLLKDIRVSADTVYPGFHGLVEGLKEQRLWDRAPPLGWYLMV